jgi:hypothetical protein
MEKPRYFVAVFGDPEPDKDPVDSGSYSADAGYPAFDVRPSDMMLLYCTEQYRRYSKQIPGIGKVISASTTNIQYKWIELPEPIPRETIRNRFETPDWQKMTELRFNSRRVFPISERSFFNTVGDLIPPDALA